jgi:hypothetical protein
VPWDQVRDIEVTGFGSDRAGLDEDFDTTQYTSVPGGSLLGSSRAWLPAVGRGMSRLAGIAIVRVDEHHVRLRAPLVSGWAADPDFDDKARHLQQLCRQYGRGAIA